MCSASVVGWESLDVVERLILCVVDEVRLVGCVWLRVCFAM